MKNLQRLLFAAVFASMMPSMVILCLEESTEASTEPLTTLSLTKFVTRIAGSYCFVAGAYSKSQLTSINKKLNDLATEKHFFTKVATTREVTKLIKRNNVLMGASCLAIAGSSIVSTVVDKFNAINKQNKENDKAV